MRPPLYFTLFSALCALQGIKQIDAQKGGNNGVGGKNMHVNMYVFVIYVQTLSFRISYR